MDELRMGIDRKTHRLREESLARKRNQEYHKQLFWNDITNYYKTWDLQVSKYNVWASQPQSPVSAKQEKLLEKESLEQRRAKLKELLAHEKKQLEEELKELNKRQKSARSSYKPISEDKIESVDLEMMMKEQENGRHEAAIQKYHQWKAEHPILQNLKKNRCQESMKKCWIEQMKEKQRQKEKEKELMQKLEEENEKQRKLEEEREVEVARKKQEEMRQLKNYLLNQIQEVKLKDEITEQLKLEEQKEIKLKMELERIAVERNQVEKQRRNRELRSILRHQYQTRLKQRNKQIQEELQEDKRLIDEITRCIEKEEAEDNKIRIEARKEIDRANAMLAEYTRLEKQREREMEFMFFEEARKMWQNQETRWNAEQEARNHLMRDVLITIQKQVKDKLQKNAEKHTVLINEKEALIQSIEDVNKQLKEKETETARKKKEYMMDLQRQIKEKEYQKDCQEQEKHKELLNQQAKLQQEEEMILQELKKMTTSSIPRVPKIHTLWR